MAEQKTEHSDTFFATATHFIKNIIEADLSSGKYSSRRWAGRPGIASDHAVAPLDPAKIRTRFPPEPNGHLHFGHAKSILLNFGLAAQYGGRCHLRFDDTNPEKEEQEYVDAIIEAVQWLGGQWQHGQENNLYYASNYFGWMITCAEHLIQNGHAYVDSEDADTIRKRRGTLTEPGQNSPFRERSREENANLFKRMQQGEFPDGSHVLRAKIDMASPNLNLRDPIIYRIRHAKHHHTGDQWCVYPMYTFAHPIEDALENITHSICTLEFEDQRPFYDWLLTRLSETTTHPEGYQIPALIQKPLPQQIEFSRLNLTHVVLSKRKLIDLVEQKHVKGWDDPRMPTLAGARRRGYPAAGFQRFAERIGISKADSLIDYSVLEDSMREILNDTAERRIAVLSPLKLIITNYPEDQSEICFAPRHPLKPELGKRQIPFSRELWIEHEDFMITPSKGYHRLYPGNRVRLRYGYVIECIGYEQRADGSIAAVHAQYLPDSKSGTPGADNYKIKGNLHWLSVPHAYASEIRLYDRLFKTATPCSPALATAEYSLAEDLNPDSLRTITAQLEPELQNAQPEECFQFERHGYFTADRVDSQPGAPVFNRTVTLKDSWSSTSSQNPTQ